MYHISIATQSLFLETNQILLQKKLTVIKFRKIYNFEGKNGDVEEDINFVKKMMIIEDKNKETKIKDAKT